MPINPTPFEPTDGGIRVRVRVTPKASANRVQGLGVGAGGETVLKVQVTAVPEGGKANAALIKLLAKEWRVPKSSVSVFQGATDRSKVLVVEGDTGDLMKQLTRWMEESYG